MESLSFRFFLLRLVWFISEHLEGHACPNQIRHCEQIRFSSGEVCNLKTKIDHVVICLGDPVPDVGSAVQNLFRGRYL